MTGFDTSVETLQRLVGELRWLTPPALTNGVLDQICEELESVIGLGSPVAGYSSWSAKERPDIGGAFLMDLVPPLRRRLHFLVSEATSWDPEAAAAVIERAQGLAARASPLNADDARGLLNLMALAAMDLLDLIAPTP